MAASKSAKPEEAVSGKARPKKPKTGGRAKKTVDQMLDEAERRDRIARLSDDTMVPEELAAIFIGTTAKNLADTRRAYVAKVKDPGQKNGSDAPPLPDIFKLMKPGAVGSNQDVLYKMKDLRAHIDSVKAPTSHQVAVNSGLFSFMTTQMPFFAEPSASKRGPLHILLASAWDLEEASRDELFAKAVAKAIDIVWLTPMEAASGRWSATAAHRVFADAALAVLKDAQGGVESAYLATELHCSAGPAMNGSEVF